MYCLTVCARISVGQADAGYIHDQLSHPNAAESVVDSFLPNDKHTRYQFEYVWRRYV
jgi:hypothetical protein